MSSFDYFDCPPEESPSIKLGNTFIPAYSIEGLSLMLDYLVGDGPNSTTLYRNGEGYPMSRSVAACAAIMMVAPLWFSVKDEIRQMAISLPKISFAETSANNIITRAVSLFTPMVDGGWGIRSLRPYGYYFGLKPENYPNIPSFANNYQNMSQCNYSPLIDSKGNIVTVTRSCYRVLSILAAKPNILVTRDELEIALYGKSGISNNAMDVFISRLRNNTEIFDYSIPSWRITSLRGLGYIYEFSDEVQETLERTVN